MTGTRKSAQTVKAQVILLLVFWVFVLGVTGNLGAFVWGNVAVHRSQMAGNSGGKNGEQPTPQTQG